MKLSGINNEDCSITQFGIQLEAPEDFLKKVREISERYGVFIVLFNAEMMAGVPHICSALQHAFRSFNEGSAISNSPEMEALLFASGSRQCQTAVHFGIHPGRNLTYLCICPCNEGALKDIISYGYIIDEDLENISDEKRARLMDFFGITSAELEVVGGSRFIDLILERVALLEVHR